MSGLLRRLYLFIYACNVGARKNEKSNENYTLYHRVSHYRHRLALLLCRHRLVVSPGGILKRDWNHRLDAYFVSFCRRVFRWSPAYKEARAAAFVHKHEKLNWYTCAACKTVWPRPQTRVDHIEPVIPIAGWDHSWESLKSRMSFDQPKNLQILCVKCHQQKTNAENKERRVCRKNASRRV